MVGGFGQNAADGMAQFEQDIFGRNRCVFLCLHHSRDTRRDMPRPPVRPLTGVAASGGDNSDPDYGRVAAPLLGSWRSSYCFVLLFRRRNASRTILN